MGRNDGGVRIRTPEGLPPGFPMALRGMIIHLSEDPRASRRVFILGACNTLAQGRTAVPVVVDGTLGTPKSLKY